MVKNITGTALLFYIVLIGSTPVRSETSSIGTAFLCAGHRAPPHRLYRTSDSSLSSHAPTPLRLSRRSFLSSAGGVGAGLTLTPFVESCDAATGAPVSLPPSSSALETGLLEGRVSENLLSFPRYGMEVPDIFYPSYFNGIWNASSALTRVEAPAGIGLFGGNATFSRTLEETSAPPLQYKSRFLMAEANQAIADREYNVKTIVAATMGEQSMRQVRSATPNKFCCVVAPASSGGTLFAIDIIALNRRQERVSDTEFHCAETVRQLIKRIGVAGDAPSGSNAPIIKEIETVSLYTSMPPIEQMIGEEKVKLANIRCIQRTATYLVPGEDPLSLKKWEIARGRPVDVRFYDVTYTQRIS
mmetsp:Transcript_21566/g.43255  ORF Transcript_21566/g.43255 Transcript_21566/m.43255 type:complete len:358 (-) Transcript_21566:267-1340(-)|eukprot:CAMPEP_0194331344 /NCGR_PEP_ID=MMETSP0171-20130528/55258_1 /TAXON_ID=218684 /ORGANISM="Corethron pennatum, Strain L29A3" /LENGTH=357 /DNA_ID=CAMNT_0039092783 /DNA_START=81 /DNA_END=1154 /DNA_ORIENTATION=-